MGEKENDSVGMARFGHESGRPTIRRAMDRLPKFTLPLLCAMLATAAFGSPLDTPEDKAKSDERKLSRRLIRGTTADDEDIMEKIIRLMDQTARRLEVDFDAGEETQALQLEVLKQLDDAVKLAAAQTRKSSGQQRSSESDRRRRQEKDKSRNAEASPNKGESASTAPAGRKPTAGGINDRDDLAESRRGWGNLPQRERDEVIQGAGERYLERYRKWIEQYYRALQEAGE
ncbi:MAG: hypothetical protein IIC51_02305 [Planctomycetes bacterium]|nr:hypothetical protein [Planctomycetota bacterium]